MTNQNNGISVKMQEKIKRQGTRAGLAIVNDEGGRGAEVAVCGCGEGMCAERVTNRVHCHRSNRGIKMVF